VSNKGKIQRERKGNAQVRRRSLAGQENAAYGRLGTEHLDFGDRDFSDCDSALE
jgi:hypothetical protein